MDTVEPIKTDTPRDRPKCPSERGVRLIEILKSIGIRQKRVKSIAYCDQVGLTLPTIGLLEQPQI